MFLMLRGLPVLLEIGLLVFCLIDCVQTPPESVRNLGKGWWIVLILLMPIVGGIAWLVVGRPNAARSARAPWPSTRTAGYPEYERPGGHRAPDRAPMGPDDDPLFLAELSKVNREQEQTLKQWEADLARREKELRARESGATPQDTPEQRPDDAPGTAPGSSSGPSC